MKSLCLTHTMPSARVMTATSIGPPTVSSDEEKWRCRLVMDTKLSAMYFHPVFFHNGRYAVCPNRCRPRVDDSYDHSHNNVIFMSVKLQCRVLLNTDSVEQKDVFIC